MTTVIGTINAILVRIFSLLCMFFLITACDPRTSADLQFNEKLSKNLKNTGDIVYAKNIMGGDWTQVCVLSAYEKLSKSASQWWLKIPLEDVKVLNTVDS